MFTTVLIANRGEIACRIAATCRRLGVRAAAVHSDADSGALHVRAADAAVRIGPAPSAESYLDADAILDAARRVGAEAVHPGYGFLSENADFAEACAAAGLVFVGPPPEAIRAMGDKGAARAAMEEAGVPVLGGYHGAAQDDRSFAAAAARIGYPVLVKPVAGGGGRGLRTVEEEGGLGAALAAARREGASSFGDDRLLLERRLAAPRHVEVQVFADGRGDAVHLFERDCSVQRRNQKVVEEAPAPGLPEAVRTALAEAALRAARAVGYVGAGTVEFLLDEAGAFFFIEMNTRLQVEHPVTEMVTGLDLVEWQLRVAAGERLPAAQAELAAAGHAVEARLYAEDPDSGFLPAVGRIARFDLPAPAAGIRVDAGIASGDAVTAHYDPLIAKIAAHGRTRAEARARLRAALAATVVAGVATNRDFLLRVLAHPEFAAGAPDTGFVARNRAALAALPEGPPDRVLAEAARVEFAARRDRASEAAARAGDPQSPWAGLRGWRLNAPASETVTLRRGAEIHEVEAKDGGFFVSGGGRALSDPGPAPASARVGGEIWVVTDEATWRFSVVDPLGEAETAAGAAAADPSAPMPGTVVAVEAAPGAEVEAGAVLMVIEAMKVEHTIRAPAAGRVEAVHYRVGDAVEEGAPLVAFAPADADDSGGADDGGRA